jgi:hypothetical protein
MFFMGFVGDHNYLRSDVKIQAEMVAIAGNLSFIESIYRKVIIFTVVTFEEKT